MQAIHAGKTFTYRAMRTAIYTGAILLSLCLMATGADAADPACTDCHNPGGGAPLPHDSGCRNTSCLASCHPKHLGFLQHPTGAGTPVTSDRTATCNTCHNQPFDGVYHPYRINVLAGSPTIAGVVDLNQACGQCHGGGTNSTDNPPQPLAPYLTKAQLGTYATNIHNDRPTVSIGATLDAPNTLTAKLFATAYCVAGCDVYEWDCGGGTLTVPSSGPAVNATCAYTTAGAKRVTLTVRDNGVGEGTASRVVTVYTPDWPPTVDGTACGSLLGSGLSSWTATLVDSSTDPAPGSVNVVTVNWGDGSTVTTGARGSTFTHVYRAPGTYNLVHKAIDNAGQQSVRTCLVPVSYFTIGGTVLKRDGVPLASASVAVKNVATGLVVARVYTATGGTFSVGSLKPGQYTLTVTKLNYTFPIPAATVTVGPSSPGNTVTATAP